MKRNGMIRTVTIAGVGLIGGSFALALRRAGFTGRILGVSSQKTIDQAVRLGVVDAGVSLEEGAASGDLVYLAQPISRILDQLPLIGPHVRASALVTDAGSTKHLITEAAYAHLPPGTFLGGHPMAGKESRGVCEAEAGLFQGRTYILTPENPQMMQSEKVREFVDWVVAIGAKPMELSAKNHDKVVAYVSHLAQMASTALAETVSNNSTGTNALKAAGPGLLDMTRLAMSSYDVWKDIISTNRESIIDAIDDYILSLQKLKSILGSPGTEAFFASASHLARQVRRPS